MFKFQNPKIRRRQGRSHIIVQNGWLKPRLMEESCLSSEHEADNESVHSRLENMYEGYLLRDKYMKNLATPRLSSSRQNSKRAKKKKTELVVDEYIKEIGSMFKRRRPKRRKKPISSKLEPRFMEDFDLAAGPRIGNGPSQKFTTQDKFALPRGECLRNLKPHPNAGSEKLEKLKTIFRKAMKLNKTTDGIDKMVANRKKKAYQGNHVGTNDRVKQEKTYIQAIKMHNPIWYVWDPLVLIAYGREAMDIALSVAFVEFRSNPRDTVHLAIFVVSIVEILFNFVRAGSKNQTLKQVAKKYFSFLFWLDLIAMFQLEVYLFILIVFKFVRIRQMLRGGSTIEHFVTKLIDNTPSRKQHDNSNFLIGRVVGKLIKVFLWGLMCVFMLTLLIITIDYEFVTLRYQENPTFFNIFAPSVTYLLTTMTTVGYGDLVPVKQANQFYTLFFQLGGIILYGYMFQQVLIFIHKSRGYMAMRLERDEDLDSWLIRKEKAAKVANKYHNVIPKTKIAFNFIWKWDIEGIYGSDFFLQLPPKLMTTLSEDPMSYLLRYFSSFFKIFEYQDCLNLAYQLQPRMFIQNEIIAEDGDQSLGIYFILSGSVGVSLTTESSIKILNYNSGSFFGEIMVLDENFSRTYQVISKSVECLFLSYESFYAQLMDDKTALEKVRSIALYKKLALNIEETKFNDMIKEVVDKMIELKEHDELRGSKKKYTIHMRKFKKDAVFKKLLYSALNEVVLSVLEEDQEDSKQEECKQVIIEAFLDKIYPEKKIEDLRNLRNAISFKNRAFFFNSQLTEQNLVPLQEPEPEIMNLMTKGKGFGPVQPNTKLDLDEVSPVTNPGPEEAILNKGALNGEKGKVDPRNLDIWQYGIKFEESDLVTQQNQAHLRVQPEIENAGTGKNNIISGIRNQKRSSKQGPKMPQSESFKMQNPSLNNSISKQLNGGTHKLSNRKGVTSNGQSFAFNESSFMRTDEHKSVIHSTRGEFRVHQSRLKSETIYQKASQYTAKDQNKHIQQKYAPTNLSPIIQDESPFTEKTHTNGYATDTNPVKSSSKHNKVSQFGLLNEQNDPITRAGAQLSTRANQYLPTLNTKMETAPNEVLETRNYNPYDVLETEGQNLLTAGEEVVIMDRLQKEGHEMPFNFKNYDISFEEQYLSSEETDKKVLQKSQFTKHDDEFITQQKVKTWTKNNSSRGLNRRNGTKAPSNKTFTYHGLKSQDVYNKLFDKMIVDNIQQLVKDNRDSFLSYYDSHDIDGSSSFSSSTHISTNQPYTVLRHDSDDSYLDHEQSSDEDSLDYPVENLNPQKRTLFSYDYKDQMETMVKGQSAKLRYMGFKLKKLRYHLYQEFSEVVEDIKRANRRAKKEHRRKERRETSNVDLFNKSLDKFENNDLDRTKDIGINADQAQASNKENVCKITSIEAAREEQYSQDINSYNQEYQSPKQQRNAVETDKESPMINAHMLQPNKGPSPLKNASMMASQKKNLTSSGNGFVTGVYNTPGNEYSNAYRKLSV